MGERILVRFNVEVEVVDREALTAAAIQADEADQAWARPASATAELHEAMREQPSLALSALLHLPGVVANAPGVQITGSQHTARDLAGDERLFPREGERKADFPSR